jgi:hypothetical protein
MLLAATRQVLVARETEVTHGKLCLEQTVWKRHHKWSADGTWDRVLAELLAGADGAGELDWRVSVDSTVV